MKKLNASDVQLLLNKWQILYERKQRLDFHYGYAMSDDEYRTWTSLSRSRFDDLVDRVSLTTIRNSSNRSIRTAIAILLCKLRLGLSHQLLALLFGLPDKKAVSRILASARDALMSAFVP